MTASILSIGNAVPRYKSNQQELVAFMKKYLAKDKRTARNIQVLFGLSGIESRYSVLPDFTVDENNFEFFPRNETLEPFPTTQRRMETYQEYACPLAVAAVDDCLKNIDIQPSEITHLVTISCTGMYAPGIDIELIEQLGLRTTVERTAINFMGCYGVFNGLKVADNIVKANPQSNVLVVAVELCSIHFQKNTDDDTLLSNTLFGDGAAAVIVGQSENGPALEMEHFHNDLALNGKSEMGWFVKDLGFEMRLSGEIPRIIEDGIAELTHKLLEHLETAVEDVAHFAIHPGGRKILDVIEETLRIDPEKNRSSRNVLKNFGNMSSPSVLFALKEIWNSLKPADDEKRILSFAFGPGLTMESMLLKIST